MALFDSLCFLCSALLIGGAIVLRGNEEVPIVQLPEVMLMLSFIVVVVVCGVIDAVVVVIVISAEILFSTVLCIALSSVMFC